ncbi:MAG: HAD family hydrolase [Candidatus Marinimicrobia bacterium]|nr:HAD family hydrolase [Candidatus Neomarinimicrobiota bacterium]
MKIKHIIWDWNGTLLNDRWLCVESINKTLQKRKLPTITEDRYLDIFCFPVEDYYKKLGFDFDKEPFAVSGTEFITNYNSKFHEPDLQEGVVDLLEFVQSKGLTQSILSAGKHDWVQDWVAYHGLEKYFINVLGINNHYASGKTDIGKAWINEMHYDPHEVLMIGDTLHDLDVAGEMGVECILIACGHTSRARLEATNAVVVENLNVLKDWLLKNLPLNEISRT